MKPIHLSRDWTTVARAAAVVMLLALTLSSANAQPLLTSEKRPFIWTPRRPTRFIRVWWLRLTPHRSRPDGDDYSRLHAHRSQRIPVGCGWCHHARAHQPKLHRGRAPKESGRVHSLHNQGQLRARGTVHEPAERRFRRHHHESRTWDNISMFFKTKAPCRIRPRPPRTPSASMHREI